MEDAEEEAQNMYMLARENAADAWAEYVEYRRGGER